MVWVRCWKSRLRLGQASRRWRRCCIRLFDTCYHWGSFRRWRRRGWISSLRIHLVRIQGDKRATQDEKIWYVMWKLLGSGEDTWNDRKRWHKLTTRRNSKYDIIHNKVNEINIPCTPPSIKELMKSNTPYGATPCSPKCNLLMDRYSVMKQIIRWLQAFLILSTVLRVGGVAGAASRKCGNAKDLVRF